VGVREIFITQEATRTRLDYAAALRFISDTMFPDAEKIILVEDNLNTHEDGSWLNIAESEISAVTRTAISPRVDSTERFRSQCEAAAARRNQECRKTNWQFSCDDSRVKLESLYPSFQT
jgi:hypothetical protein